MKITSIRMILKDEENLKALVSVVFDDMFALHGIKIIEGTHGLFMAMPSRKTRDGKFADIFYPVTKEAREELLTAIIEEYNKKRN